MLACALLPLLPAVTSARAQRGTFLTFDSHPPGTRVEYTYMPEGVRFVNDYAPGRFFRSGPTIRAHANAHSGSNVVVNESYDNEIYTNAGIPLVIFFTEATTGVAPSTRRSRSSIRAAG